MNDRITDTAPPSEFFPERGNHFRIQYTTIPDRSHINHIWECLESQDHGVLAKLVYIPEFELRNGSAFKLGDIVPFAAGDVRFYDCSKLWSPLLKHHEPT